MPSARRERSNPISYKITKTRKPSTQIKKNPVVLNSKPKGRKNKYVLTNEDNERMLDFFKSKEQLKSAVDHKDLVGKVQTIFAEEREAIKKISPYNKIPQCFVAEENVLHCYHKNCKLQQKLILILDTWSSLEWRVREHIRTHTSEPQDFENNRFVVFVIDNQKEVKIMGRIGFEKLLMEHNRNEVAPAFDNYRREMEEMDFDDGLINHDADVNELAGTSEDLVQDDVENVMIIFEKIAINENTPESLANGEIVPKVEPLEIDDMDLINVGDGAVRAENNRAGNEEWINDDVRIVLDELDIKRQNLYASLPQEKAKEELVEAILDASYGLAVRRPKELNKKKTDKSLTYGEVLSKQTAMFCKQLKLQPHHTVVDMGSGIGEFVCAVAGFANVQRTVGIELLHKPATLAVKYREIFGKIMDYFKLKRSTVELHQGDFCDEQFENLITREADVIFINNFAFQPDLMNKLRTLFEKCRTGTRVLFSQHLVGERFYRSPKYRTTGLPSVTTPVSEFPIDTFPGNCSWTYREVKFYLTKFIEPRPLDQSPN